uniref:Uncharacterized protein n=1 Tax=Avena sativa TaxID=4498 RepID=A0ACD5Z6L4_AVESA
MCPSSLLPASEMATTVPPMLLQVMPSHLQQFVPFCQDAARPPSSDSLARNWRREVCSCSVQEVVGEAKEEISSTRARPWMGIENLLLLMFLEEEQKSGCIVYV